MNGDGKTIVTLRVDGNFDKTGLPDPLLFDFQFTLDTNKICELDIRLPGEGPGAYCLFFIMDCYLPRE
jgi:hypothetical protein